MATMPINVDADLAQVGAVLAHLSAREQAEALNAFAKELALACGTHYKTGQQCHSIGDLLTLEAKECCKTLGYEAEESSRP